MSVMALAVRIALVAVVAIGVLAMHGLATAELEGAVVPSTGVAALHSGATPDDHGGGHNDLGHIGIVCTWLLVTTGAAIAARGVTQRWRTRRSAAAALGRGAASLHAPSARSPDPPPTAVAPLIC